MLDKLTHYSFTTPASVYDEEAMTALELAGRMGVKINQVIEELNTLAGKITMEDIQRAIDKTIKEMKDSGELNEQILESLGNLNDNFLINNKAELQFNREFRILKERYRYGTDSYKAKYEQTAFSLQSLCHATHPVHGSVFVLGYCNSDSTVSALELRHPSGELILSQTYNTLGHCNSLTCVNDKLYVCTLNNAVAVVDLETLAVTNFIDFPVALRAIALDKKTGKVYGASGATYYEIDLYNIGLTQLFTTSFIKGTWQSFAVYDGVFYEASSMPEMLTVFRVGELLNSYNIAQYSGYHYFGEAEDVEIVDGVLYIASQWQMTNDNYRHDNVWSIPLNYNYTFKPVTHNFTANGLNKFYCVAGHNCLNPDGTEEKPFACLSEAMNALSSPYAVAQKVMDIMATGNFDEMLYVRQQTFRMIGDGSTTIKSAVNLTSCYAYFEKMNISNNDTTLTRSLYTQNTTFNGMNTVFKTELSSQTNACAFSFSDITLHGDFITDTSKFTTPVNAYFTRVTGNSTALINGVTFSPALVSKP